MQQNYFVVPTKRFAISIKFWLLKQNVLLVQQNVLSGQQKKFCCINFVFSTLFSILADTLLQNGCMNHFEFLTVALQSHMLNGTKYGISDPI